MGAGGVTEVSPSSAGGGSRFAEGSSSAGEADLLSGECFLLFFGFFAFSMGGRGTASGAGGGGGGMLSRSALAAFCLRACPFRDRLRPLLVGMLSEFEGRMLTDLFDFELVGDLVEGESCTDDMEIEGAGEGGGGGGGRAGDWELSRDGGPRFLKFRPDLRLPRRFANGFASSAKSSVGNSRASAFF